jgi:hypothetical protein
MWKPAFCAGSQALWESGKSPTFDFSPISTARHFHSETGKPAKSGPSALTDMLAVGFGADQAHFGKPLKMRTSSDSCAGPFFLYIKRHPRELFLAFTASRVMGYLVFVALTGTYLALELNK